MTDAGFFRGTSADQDNRFSDKEKKLLKQMKFSDSITKKVDMSKVDLKVMKPWISDRLSELLGIEDDVLNEFVFNQLEAENHPDGRKIQINLTGFLNGKNARIFTGELWDMLLDAMDNQGIPSSILEAKKQEISQRIKSEQPSLVMPEIKDSSRQPPRTSDSRGEDPKKQYGLVNRSRDNSRDRSNTDRRRDYRDERRSRDERERDRPDRGDRHGRDDRSRRDDRYRDRDPRDKPSIRYLESSSRPSRFNDNKDSGRDRRDRSPPPRARSRSRSPRQKPRDNESPKTKDEEFTVQEKKLPSRGSDDEAPPVEMKKHKKSKHRHNRKRKGSDDSGHSGSDEDNDDENAASDSGSEDRHRKSRHNKDKKKKKKSKRSRSKEPLDSEGKNLEQELRVRALESMKRQRESVDED